MDADAEKSRINDLQLYEIMDTAAEKAFDDITGLASMVCETPISLVSFVDDHRQWFKSRQGLDTTETPREHAFCAHVIQGDNIMVVEDAHNDSRFADNPLVTGEPNIRFYAGAPIIVESGAALGTLCVVDREPRILSKVQLQSLEVLRDVVVSLLELRRAASDLEALHKIIPMCAWCRNVRIDAPDTEGTTWQPLHEYVARTSPVTHGICPNCQEIELEGIKGD